MNNLNQINGDKQLYNQLCWWMTEYADWKTKVDRDDCGGIDEAQPEYIIELLKQAVDVMDEIHQSCRWRDE